MVDVFCGGGDEYKRWAYLLLSYDPYSPARAFFAKPLTKVPYEGRTHLRKRGQKKPYGPTTKASASHVKTVSAEHSSNKGNKGKNKVTKKKKTKNS